MPKITASIEREPLFSDDDPLVIVIPGVGEFRLSDYEVNPPNEDEVNPERRPVTYLVEYLAGMAWESADDVERGLTPKADELAQKLTDALAEDRITLRELGDLLGDVAEAQDKAARALASRSSGRPTRRRPR